MSRVVFISAMPMLFVVAGLVAGWYSLCATGGDCADPARGLTAGGAEIVVMPIWGGDQALAKARAIENQVYLVASGYDHPTYIMNPSGEWLAVARERGSAAIATIDLSKSLRQDNNLGDMRNRLPKELRLDVATGIPGHAK